MYNNARTEFWSNIVKVIEKLTMSMIFQDIFIRNDHQNLVQHREYWITRESAYYFHINEKKYITNLYPNVAYYATDVYVREHRNFDKHKI